MTVHLSLGLRQAGCLLATHAIERQLPKLPTEGALFLWVLPAAVSLTLNENADDTVQSDMQTAFNRLASQLGVAGVQPLLMRRHLVVPIRGGHLWTGTWQGIHVYAWQDLPSEVTMVAHIVSSSSSSSSSQTYDTAAKSSRRRSLGLSWPEIGSAERQLCLLHLKHTSAALALASKSQAETAAQQLEKFADSLCPESWNQHFVHTYEGPDDMPGHVKSSLFGAALLYSPAADGAAQPAALLLEPRSRHSRKVSTTLFPVRSVLNIKVSVEGHTATDILPLVMRTVEEQGSCGANSKDCSLVVVQLTADAQTRLSLQHSSFKAKSVIDCWQALGDRGSGPMWSTVGEMAVPLPLDLTRLSEQCLYLGNVGQERIEQEIELLLV